MFSSVCLREVERDSLLGSSISSLLFVHCRLLVVLSLPPSLLLLLLLGRELECLSCPEIIWLIVLIHYKHSSIIKKYVGNKQTNVIIHISTF